MPTYPTLRYQGQDLIRIGDADNVLLLAPWAGGRLVRWIQRGIDILYWPDDGDWSRPAKIRGGNPLLFPFIGRHFVDGEPGKWRDAAGVVRTMPQHGFARDLPFDVVDLDPPSAITMALTDSDATRDAYPFAFRFAVGYRLLPDGLEASFDVHNPGSEPLPFYAGHHFYFAVPHALHRHSRLALPPARRVRQRPDGGLTAAEPGEPRYTLDDPQLQDTFHLLDAAAGTVELAMPSHHPGHADGSAERTLRIALGADTASIDWRAVTTWREHAQADYYCVEPWLGLPDAIHRHDEACWVQPGESVRAVCKIHARW